MAMTLKSPSFEHGGKIPKEHACDGAGYPPALSWDGVPEGTASLALIVDDPDAPMGTWDHWVVYNLPADLDGFIEDIEGAQGFPDGTKQGLNSWKRIGWGGPCPPDREHRYFFRLYALDTRLDLPQKARKDEVLSAMQGHVKAQAELMGRYAPKGK